VRVQQVQQFPPAGICQGLEQHVGVVALCHALYASHHLPKS
jgi:hypothetical protein